METNERTRLILARQSCSTTAVAATTFKKPLLYMLLSSVFLVLLVIMFSRTFGPQSHRTIHGAQQTVSQIKVEQAHVTHI